MAHLKTTLIHTARKEEYEGWLKIYEKDRLAARIFCINKKPVVTRFFLYYTSDKNFKIEESIMSYGVSVTLKKHISFRRGMIISVKENKILYFQTRGVMIRHLELNAFLNLPEFIREILREKFKFIRFLEETKFYGLAFSSILRYKLYSYEKCVKHVYKTNYHLAKLLHRDHNLNLIDWSSKYSKLVIGSENINKEIEGILIKKNGSEHGILVDTLNMAWKLCTTVNLSWSYRRLKEEHDDMSKRITILSLSEPEYELSINKDFKEAEPFLKENGLNIIKTNVELITEGAIQRHCVATYANKINNGNCVILKYDKYTIELTKLNDKFKVLQIKGFANCKPDKESEQVINNIIDKYNNQISEPLQVNNDELIEELVF